MRRDYDYIVVGLGGIGSGAAYWLARRAGADVLGLEQFELGHERGASEDHSRIIRLAYHRPEYVELAKKAFEAWSALESEIDDQLILFTGGLDLFPAQTSIAIETYTESLSACAVPFEVLDAGAAMKRWPQFMLPGDIAVLWQATGGIAPAARCNRAHLRAARSHGATLRPNTRVQKIVDRGDGIELSTADGTFTCSKLIVAADAWVNDLLGPLGIELPLTITQEQVNYYESPMIEEFTPSRFPVWIWHDDPEFYGMPVYGELGVKVAQDVGGDEVTATTRTFEPNRPMLERVEKWMEQYLPSARGPVASIKTCLYTLPPDRDLVLDSVPGHPGVLVALGAGHGFKFASLMGRILSELAVDGHTAHDLEPFKIDRPALINGAPPQSFTM